MGWFSDLFTTKNVVTDSGLPKVSNIPPMPTPCKPEKEISEPVYAIVKAMQERPSSFKLISTNNTGGRSFSQTEYTVKDIKTNQVLIVTYVISFYGDLYSHYSYSWSWLSQDEGDLLLAEFVQINKKKMRRKLNMQRLSMKEIYK